MIRPRCSARSLRERARVLESPDGVYNASVARGLEWYERKGLPSLLCGIAKVGITNMAAAGFRLVRRRRRLREKLADPAFARAVLVRSPFERFASFYRNKIQMIATYRNRTLALDPETHVRAYNALLLRRANDSAAHAPRPTRPRCGRRATRARSRARALDVAAPARPRAVRRRRRARGHADFARRMRGEGGELRVAARTRTRRRARRARRRLTACARGHLPALGGLAAPPRTSRARCSSRAPTGAALLEGPGAPRGRARTPTCATRGASTASTGRIRRPRVPIEPRGRRRKNLFMGPPFTLPYTRPND